MEIFGGLAFLGLVFYVFMIGGATTKLLIGSFFVICIITLIIVVASGKDYAKRRDEIIKSVKYKVNSIVENHIDALCRRRLSLITVNHYGVMDRSNWDKELKYFIENVIFPSLSKEEADAIASLGSKGEFLQSFIEDKVAPQSDKLRAETQVTGNMTPEEFERYCADKLTARGWSARTTKASGDQGADVIAERAGVRVVLQCKLYSSPVGNKAVQEALSAKLFYGAKLAAVVSNADFTRSARELANTTGVALLHHGELSNLDQLVA